MKNVALYMFVVFALSSISVAQPDAASVPLEKPRVFVSDSQSWEARGAAGGSSNGWGASSSAGARPQTAEVIKTLGERCPGVLVNGVQDRADFVILFDHEGGKGLLRNDNKIAVFEKISGDIVFSKSTRSLGSAVQNACEAIGEYWQKHSARILNDRPGVANLSEPSGGTGDGQVASGNTEVTVNSKPESADIEVDGAFVGNTPSTIHLVSGDHIVRVMKEGYQPYERKLRTSGGSVSLQAVLQVRTN